MYFDQKMAQKELPLVSDQILDKQKMYKKLISWPKWTKMGQKQVNPHQDVAL